MTTNIPASFLDIRVRDLSALPTLRAACVGYEQSEWRAKQLAEHLMEWLPDFALDPIEATALDSGNALRMLRRAAHNVYTSEKYKSRGEFGEILLHALMRQDCNSIPAISKVFFKDSPNDTVKGFDAVHVVGDPDELELWLGEAKFYSDRSAAIRESLNSIESHLSGDYLRREFIAVTAKLNKSHPHAGRLARLLDVNTSLDQIFARMCVPVLITYDSTCVASHNAISEEYIAEFVAEARATYEAFHSRLAAYDMPEHVRIHVMLMPLQSKAALVGFMNEELKRWQPMH